MNISYDGDNDDDVVHEATFNFNQTKMKTKKSFREQALPSLIEILRDRIYCG